MVRNRAVESFLAVWGLLYTITIVSYEARFSCDHLTMLCRDNSVATEVGMSGVNNLPARTWTCTALIRLRVF